MQRSKLDEIYSLSNKITCKEMISKFENYEKLWQEEKAELNNYIDPFTRQSVEIQAPVKYFLREYGFAAAPQPSW